MGAPKYPLAAAVMVLCSALGATTSKRHHAEAVVEHVWTHAAIQRWAEQEYLSGAPPILFTRGHKEVVVVLGSHTSGLPSTEIVVFSGNAGGPYERMLVRSTFYGNVRVHDDGEALVFTARDPVLIIPWTGVVADLEQVPPK